MEEAPKEHTRQQQKPKQHTPNHSRHALTFAERWATKNVSMLISGISIEMEVFATPFQGYVHIVIRQVEVAYMKESIPATIQRSGNEKWAAQITLLTMVANL
jgi:hypothetical protein